MRLADAADILTPPKIEPDLIRACRKADDFAPALFVPYQAVMHLCGFIANIAPDSECLNKLPPIHFAVLTGMLCRCARLMDAVTHLSHDGTFGEVTTILDRCIFEASVKVQWLCTKRDPESFDRLIRDGLKSDVKLKEQIEANSEARGSTLEIEQGMLESIAALFASAKVTEAEVRDSPKLQDLFAMVRDIGWPDEFYLAGQKMGSHHVHGTWASLMRDYLMEEQGGIRPRALDEPRLTQDAQYRFSMLLVLDALLAFVDLVLQEGDERTALLSAISAHRNLLGEIYGPGSGEAAAE